MPRAQPPLKRLVSAVVSPRASCGAVCRAGSGFVGEEESAANLYRVRAKRHRRAHCRRIADAARRDERQGYGAADVRQERKQPALSVRVMVEKPATVPARFQSLGDDAVRAVFCQPARFGNAGGAGKDFCTRCLDRRQ